MLKLLLLVGIGMLRILCAFETKPTAETREPSLCLNDGCLARRFGER